LDLAPAAIFAALFDAFPLAAVLIATSSNDVLKAVYTAGFAGLRAALPPAAGLAQWPRGR
jgi:hypothetical protein